MSRVYYSDIRCLENDSLFKSFYIRASKQRQKKIDSYAFKKDKMLSLGAYSLLYYVLKINGYEKPIIINEKDGYLIVENHDVFVSISHSGHYVLACFSDERIGCDVEEIRDFKDAVANACFAADEFDYLKSTGKTNEDYYSLWTMKESYVKAIRKGLTVPLKSFSVLKPNEEKLSFSNLGIMDGHAFACCHADKIDCFMNIDLEEISNE